MAADAATAVSERRRWTTAHKLKIVSESLAPNASVTEVARRHGLNPNLIYRWRHQAKAALCRGRLKVSLALRWLRLLLGLVRGL
jgi:transposase-like protein